MSSYTTNLQLFKYNTATDGKQVFSIDDAMNDNWDKIDAFAKAIKDLSNLSSVGEKRFTNINNELSQKLEAQVSLAQNGYIKFNNGVIICFGISRVNTTLDPDQTQGWDITLPTTYTNMIYIFQSKLQIGRWGQYTMSNTVVSMSVIHISAWCGYSLSGLVNFQWCTIGY